MISILAAILGLALFLIFAAALGHLLTSPFLPQFSSDAERLLYCLGAGITAFELLAMPALFAGNIRFALVAVSALVFLLGAAGIPTVIRNLSLFIQRILSAPNQREVPAPRAFSGCVHRIPFCHGSPYGFGCPPTITEVGNFYGMRILDVRERSEVVIHKVNRQGSSQ